MKKGKIQMEELSDTTITSMLQINPKISELSNQEVIEKIELLKKLDCSITQIKNIIGSNSLFLSRTNDEILNLIKCLSTYGFTALNILFDSNPYILNLEPFEIDQYINNRKDSGEELENIIDDLDSNPYLFNET